ncbi:hypothetical protein [Lactobacillus sp. ESL0681]|uniref:hypothetical protein n=1 Tax=Lactobacillus sp. ESL0681 TaxID=2983211 RepID=UPI0023F6C5A8|nr:hypothetical protein [Lactobacillus sp. ESL0681]WEV41312.1 hypothetical protein OZX59_09285 [Lactobacillus sp. ESL0681]
MKERTKNLWRAWGNELSGRNARKRDFQSRKAYLEQLQTMSYLELSAKYSRLEQRYKASRWYGIVALVLAVVFWNLGLKNLLIRYIMNVSKLDGTSKIKLTVAQNKLAIKTALAGMVFFYLIVLLIGCVCVKFRSDAKARIEMTKQMRDWKAKE